MKISPDNPHLKTLQESLMAESLGSTPSHLLDERAAILGISPSEYRDFIEKFPFLSKEEATIVLERIISWYRAKLEIRRIAIASLC